MARCWKWTRPCRAMNRVVLPELLDVLPPQDASALRSRRDLRRVNGWMGHPQIMACALRANWPGGGVRELVELGAGDGHFLLSVARRLKPPPLPATATLVDRLEVLDPQVPAQFGRCGWRVRAETAEAAHWLRHAPPGNSRMILGNLFFHQFDPRRWRKCSGSRRRPRACSSPWNRAGRGWRG